MIKQIDNFDIIGNAIILLSHSSAKPSHYDKGADRYDQFNEENSKIINHTIESILKKYNVKTVLDLTCGTGSQVFWLAKHGYDILGADINEKMLEIAKRKAKQGKLKIQFINGDMRTLEVGQFDSIITIFNSVGHLTKIDFEKAIQNIKNNLKPNGLYIFDIFNLDYLLQGNNISSLTIDWQTIKDDKKSRIIQYSTIDTEGILASYTTSLMQKDFDQPKISSSAQTLQIYSSQQLRDILEKNGFSVLDQCAIDGSKFIETKTDRILTIARKQ